MAALIDLDTVRFMRTPGYRTRDEALQAAKTFLDIVVHDGSPAAMRDGLAELHRTMGTLGIITPLT